jgi:lysozyme family protein
MAASNFNKSLGFVLKNEGLNDDDPTDHGGRTSRGITQREYTAWRFEHHLPDRDVWIASDDEIKTIYHDEYWKPWGDVFPKGIDYMFFDMAVNAGPTRAAILLQRSLGVVADGRIGPVTRNAIIATNPATLIARYSNAKRNFYNGIVAARSNQKKFIKGWLNRVADVQKNALTMI